MNIVMVRLLWVFFNLLSMTPAVSQLRLSPVEPVSLKKLGISSEELPNHVLGIPRKPLTVQRILNACQCDLLQDGTIDDGDLKDLKGLSNTSNREERDSCAKIDNRFNSYNVVDESDVKEMDELLNYFSKRTINCSEILKVISLADDGGLRIGCDFKVSRTGSIEKVSYNGLRLGYHSIDGLDVSHVEASPNFFEVNEDTKILEIKKALFKRGEINWWYPYHFTRSIPPYELLSHAGQIGAYLKSENLQQLTPWLPVFRNTEDKRIDLVDYNQKIEEPAYCKADQMLEFTPYCQIKDTLLGDKEKLNLATDETKIYFQGSSTFVLMSNTLLTALDPQYNSRPLCVLDRQTKNEKNH